MMILFPRILRLTLCRIMPLLKVPRRPPTSMMILPEPPALSTTGFFHRLVTRLVGAVIIRLVSPVGCPPPALAAFKSSVLRLSIK